MKLEDILHKLTDSVSLTATQREEIHTAIDELGREAVKVAGEAAVAAAEAAVTGAA